jgi:hypothetical protein
VDIVWRRETGLCGVVMKIGIMTIFKANNYGAELQAFALQKKLSLMGHESELIDYPFYKYPSHVASRQSKPIFNIGLKNRVKERVYPYLVALQRVPIRKDIKRKQERMDAFYRKHFRLSDVCYNSIEALYAADWSYDLFITGSDQVWNPRMNSSLDPYFLTFAPSDKPRVSYASSFGVSALPDHTKSVYRERLSAFERLSVREEQGVKIIQDLLGCSPEHVLDPTLLLTDVDWADVAVPVDQPTPYVLIYELMPCDELAAVARCVASQIEGACVVRIRGGVGISSRTDVVDVDDAGPSEFLGLLQGASAVVTNSFHGTAFAINFRKPVYPVIPCRMRNAGRIENLLESLGLSGRMIYEKSNEDVARLAEIDYDTVMGRLEQERGRSISYLEQVCSQ